MTNMPIAFIWAPNAGDRRFATVTQCTGYYTTTLPLTIASSP